MLRTARFAALSLAVSIAIALASTLAPLPAYAQDEPISPCVPTQEQHAAYTADGTFEQRAAFQENLGNDEPSAGLIQQAISREQANNGIATNAVPGDDSGMAITGKAHVLALRVAFPDKQFDEADTLEALQALIGPRSESETALPSAGPYPYESLHDYYLRASYGRLSITGEAVDYTAQHERDYYASRVGELYAEALAYLDANGIVDLAQFDANGDGRIDAVYLHFAGGDTGWGSVWWSNEQVFGAQTATYADGAVRLWNGVALSNPSDQAWAAQTIIHETGHVLGLPDFYSYLSQTGASTGRTGILTFDMMMQNQGDHNGFSKWMLGWLPDSKITRVFANEGGIDVKRGGTVVQHVDPSEDGSSSIEQVLSAFTSDNPEETGGIIVASNEDQGMFSSYYLLQYEQFAGNQSVYYERQSTATPLPSGFRLFRVQAQLGEAGGLQHSNTSGTVHNQLIELVDPDMGDAHVEGSLTVPSAVDSSAYGCMLYAGDAVSPEGYPSTNFFENGNVGFTGLTIAVTDSEDESGRVAISFSDADKPADPADFTLAPTFDSFSNVSVLTFEASSQPLLATPLPSATQLIVDGESHPLLDIAVDGTTVSLPCLLDAGSVGPSSSCEIVFPAGMFVLSQPEGPNAFSPEIRLTLKPNPSMTEVNRTGTYAGTDYQADRTTLSNMFVSPDGIQRFFQIADGILKLHTIDPDDPTRVTSINVDGVPILAAAEEQRISAGALSDDAAFVVSSNTTGTNSSAGYWIDLERGRVTASCSLDQAYTVPFAASDSTVVAATYYQGIPGDTRGGLLLTSLTPRADGSVEEHYGWTAAQGAIPTSSNSFAFPFLDELCIQTEETRIIDAAALVQALAASTAAPDNAALSGELCTPERSSAVLPLRTNRMVLDAKQTADGYNVLLSSDFTQPDPSTNLSNEVTRFDLLGNKVSSFNVPVENGDQFTKLHVARYGTVALLKSLPSNHDIALGATLFCTDNGRQISTLTTASTGTGTWLSDGSWLDVGTTIAGSFGPKGSPVQPDAGNDSEGIGENAQARYTITTQLDAKPDDPGDPGENPQPSPLPKPSGDEDAGAKPLASTGDPVGTVTLTAAVAIALAGGSLMRACARRTR